MALATCLDPLLQVGYEENVVLSYLTLRVVQYMCQFAQTGSFSRVIMWVFVYSDSQARLVPVRCPCNSLSLSLICSTIYLAHPLEACIEIH